jgi:hypothetical protein
MSMAFNSTMMLKNTANKAPAVIRSSLYLNLFLQISSMKKKGVMNRDIQNASYKNVQPRIFITSAKPRISQPAVIV